MILLWLLFVFFFADAIQMNYISLCLSIRSIHYIQLYTANLLSSLTTSSPIRTILPHYLCFTAQLRIQCTLIYESRSFLVIFHILCYFESLWAAYGFVPTPMKKRRKNKAYYYYYRFLPPILHKISTTKKLETIQINTEQLLFVKTLVIINLNSTNYPRKV